MENQSLDSAVAHDARADHAAVEWEDSEDEHGSGDEDEQDSTDEDDLEIEMQRQAFQPGENEAEESTLLRR